MLAPVVGAARMAAALLFVFSCAHPTIAPISSPAAAHDVSDVRMTVGALPESLRRAGDVDAPPSMHRPASDGHRRLRAGSGGKKREGGGEEGGAVIIIKYWEDFGDPPYVPGDDQSDSLCTIVFYIVLGTSAATIIVILSDPWWPPFEERSAGLMIMMCISSVVWSWSTLVIDNHAPKWMLLEELTPASGTATVQFWLVWVRMVAGAGAFIGCLFARLHAVNALYVVNDVNEPGWWVVRLLKYLLPWLILATLRLYILQTQMETVAAWTINLGMAAGHACFLIWMVASIDRKRERRNGVGDVNVTMCWIVLLSVGPSCWHGAAIDYDVVPYATKMSLDYDPAVDNPDPTSIQTRQVISSLLTMGLLLVYWSLTTAPLIFRCIRKYSNLAWMEANYEGPFVDYRLQLLTPEERERAGLVGQYEIQGDPTVSFDDEDEEDEEVKPPPISYLSRILGGWRYEIETNEWNDADDTHSEKRTYRTLRKFIVVEEEALTAEMCHWDVMQFDRDAELQAAEVFRSIDLDGDGHLDKDEMRKALAKLHGGQVDEDELGMVMKECDEDGNGVIDELEFVNWFKGSELARALKKQARSEKKLQAAMAELGVSVAGTGATHGLQALHTAVEVDAITGHHGSDGVVLERAWGGNAHLPGGAP